MILRHALFAGYLVNCLTAAKAFFPPPTARARGAAGTARIGIKRPRPVAIAGREGVDRGTKAPGGSLRRDMMTSSTESGAAAATPATPTSKPVLYKYAYCHGFLSDETSSKGMFLRQKLAEAGVEVELLNLNGPGGVGSVTYTGAVEAVDECYLATAEAHPSQEVKLRLLGSSLGGYVAARYASLHPSRVDRMLLLCPGFDMHSRWDTLFGREAIDKWRDKGSRTFPREGAGDVEVPFAFYEDGLHNHPPYPFYTCPTTVVHGRRDTTVHVEATQKLFSSAQQQQLVIQQQQASGQKAEEDENNVQEPSMDSAECSRSTMAMVVEDDHSLALPSTMDLIARLALGERFADVEAGALSGQGGQGQGRGQGQGQGRGQVIEVESKHHVKDKIVLEATLSALGATLVSEEMFTDVYLDWPGQGSHMGTKLLKDDVWLRLRAGLWELKVPVSGVEDNEERGLPAVYKELTNPRDILRWLKARYPRPFSGSASSASGEISNGEVREALLGAGLKVFAEYTSTRRKWQKTKATGEAQGSSPAELSRDVSVDIDEASFGYSVVEVETLVEPTRVTDGDSGSVTEGQTSLQDRKAIEQASVDVEAFAGALGLTSGPSVRVAGKLMEYIKRYCPTELDVIEAAKAQKVAEKAQKKQEEEIAKKIAMATGAPPPSSSLGEPIMALPPPPEGFAEKEGVKKLTLGGDAVKMDGAGPIIINEDGTTSAIANWDRMDEREKELSWKMISKRNAKRRKILEEQGKSVDINQTM